MARVDEHSGLARRPSITHLKNAAIAFGRNITNPRFLRRLAGSGIRFEQEGKAPTTHVLELYPDLQCMRIPVGDVEFHWSNMDPMEVYCLMGITQLYKPRRIFEFGTYDGATTARLALAAPEAEIWTLDLPDNLGELYHHSQETGTPFRGVGYRYRRAGVADRVTQLHGDSRTFDVSPWLGTMDLIVIDGGHSYEIVTSDSQNAVRLLAPGGVIVWDDYCPMWPNVVRAVDDVAAVSGLVPVHVSGTEMAVHDPHQRRRRPIRMWDARL